MNEGVDQEYLSIEQASVYLGVKTAELRKLLRAHGLGELLRASMGKRVLIRRQDLDNLYTASRQGRTQRSTRRSA